MRSIKVDEETYRLLLKLKYNHAMKGVKVTFSDLVKGILLRKCHSSDEDEEIRGASKQKSKKTRMEKATVSIP